MKKERPKIKSLSVLPLFLLRFREKNTGETASFRLTSQPVRFPPQAVVHRLFTLDAFREFMYIGRGGNPAPAGR